MVLIVCGVVPRAASLNPASHLIGICVAMSLFEQVLAFGLESSSDFTILFMEISDVGACLCKMIFGWFVWGHFHRRQILLLYFILIHRFSRNCIIGVHFIKTSTSSSSQWQLPFKEYKWVLPQIEPFTIAIRVHWKQWFLINSLTTNYCSIILVVILLVHRHSWTHLLEPARFEARAVVSSSYSSLSPSLYTTS